MKILTWRNVRDAILLLAAFYIVLTIFRAWAEAMVP